MFFQSVTRAAHKKKSEYIQLLKVTGDYRLQEPIPRGLSAPVRAKATKLGSCDKYPAHCQDKNVKVGLSAMIKIRWCIALILRLLVCSQHKVVAKFIFLSHDFFHKIERIYKGHSGFLFTTALAAYLTVIIISVFVHSAVQIYEIHIFIISPT